MSCSITASVFIPFKLQILWVIRFNDFSYSCCHISRISTWCARDEKNTVTSSVPSLKPVHTYQFSINFKQRKQRFVKTKIKKKKNMVFHEFVGLCSDCFFLINHRIVLPFRLYYEDILF